MQKSAESAPRQSAPDIVQCIAGLYNEVSFYRLAVFDYESCEACDSPIWLRPIARL